MKKYTCVLLAAALASCQKLHDYFPRPAAPQFNHVYGGSSTDGARSLVRTADGGYIFTGYSLSKDGDATGNKGDVDAWVVKLDAKGNRLWQKMLGGSTVDIGDAIDKTKDGGYILAASTVSNDGDINGGYHGGAGADAWIVKLDASGNIQWQKTLGGTAEDIPSSIITLPDGNYIMAGYTESNDGDLDDGHRTQYDAWIVKLDEQGTILWQRTLGGSEADYAQAITPTWDGGIIMTGLIQSKDAHVPGYHSRGDFWVVKLDRDGTLAWQKAYGGWNYDIAFSITATADQAYLVAGTESSHNGDIKSKHHGGVDAWIIKIDDTGKLLWEKAFGGSRLDVAASIIATQNGGSAFVGYTSSNDGDVSGLHGKDNDDAWIVALDANGNKRWQKPIGGFKGDHATSVVMRQNGDFVIAGDTQSNDGDVPGNLGSADGWVVTVKDN